MHDSIAINLWLLLLFALAAAAGGATRFLIAGVVDSRCGGGFPWGTLAVNLSGALLMGVLASCLQVLPAVDPATLSPLWLALGLGFVGSYTTVSAFSLQTLNLLQRRRMLSAAAYVMTSILGCPVLLWLGWQLAEWAQR